MNQRLPRRRYQISLIGMLGWMAAASIGAAPLYYLGRVIQQQAGEKHDNTTHAVGVILITAGPVLAVLIFAGGMALTKWLARRRK